ncbi:SRPBCC domain-containing protein [Microbacteriaceae bacterium VKM Ac-2855]|nr:SRPBCC domain-containing protein [Microbacteriaceae bacterium VKM Ac-2855]
MKSYEADVVIAAPLSTVWKVVTDGAAYSEWDSGVTKVEGTITEGARIKVFAAVTPDRAFPVHVTLSADHRVMTWTGGMPLGLFRGTRVFTLEAADEGGTHLHVREEYTGALLPLIWRSMPDLQPSFDQYTAGVAARAESLAG